MLAAALALALALGASPPAGEHATGAPSRRGSARKHAPKPAPAPALGDNAARARRGLLPRKEKRAPARNRLVYRPPAPVWLDEPRPAEEPAVAASAPSLALPEEIADGAVHAWLETPRVEILVVRRRTGGEAGPLVEATVEGALVDALLVRRRDPGL